MEQRNDDVIEDVTSGGHCETLFQCMFSMGISAGSCGGFLSVCCVKPVTINRWLHDNRINDGLNEGYKQQQVHREPAVINDPKECRCEYN